MNKSPAVEDNLKGNGTIGSSTTEFKDHGIC